MADFTGGGGSGQASVLAPGSLLAAIIARQTIVPTRAHSITTWGGFHKILFREDGESVNEEAQPNSGGGVSASLANGSDDDGPASIRYAASLSSAASAYWNNNGYGKVLQRRFRNFYGHWKFKIPSAYGNINHRRWRFGIYQTDPDTLNRAMNKEGMEFVASADVDTTWKFQTYDGVTASQVDTQIPFTNATQDQLRFFEMGFLPTGDAWFRCNGGPTITKSTNLPGASTKLDFQHIFNVINFEAGSDGVGPAVTMYKTALYW